MSSIIPTCPKDIKEIRMAISNISNSMTRVEGEKDYQKEAIKELAERFEVEAKDLRRMAADFHKDQFKKRVDEMDEYSTLYETIMVLNSSDATSDSDEEDSSYD